MRKNIKVLMVVFNLSVANGVSSFVMNLFRAINHNKIHMDFVVYQNVESPYYEEIQKAGGQVFILPSIKNLKNHMQTCQSIIQHGHYDIVHDNILILSIGIMYYAKKMRVPVRILHSHNSKLSDSKIKALRNKIFMPILKGKATDYTACSKSAAKGMFGRGIPCTIIPNTISAEKLAFNPVTREKIRKSAGVENEFVIATVGRLAVQKNPFYAIDAVCEAKKIIPNLQYWWVGTGPLNKDIQQYVKYKHAEAYIRLLGNRTDVDRLYQAMDLFFLPSLFEGLPVTGLEAQAAGLPCLVSDSVSNEFVYTDLVTFFAISKEKSTIVKTIKNISEKININNRFKYKENLQKSKFSTENIGNLMDNFYQNLYRKRV